MSSGTPIRPSGMRATDVRAISACCSAVSGMPAVSLATPSVATPPRSDGVDLDPVGRQLQRQVPGEHEHATFGGIIRGEADQRWPEAVNGGDVDDLAALSLGGHLLCRGLRAERQPPQVDRVDAVEEFRGRLQHGDDGEDPGVVDEDIQRAEVPDARGNDLFAAPRAVDARTPYH